MPVDRLAQPADILRALPDAMAGQAVLAVREVVAGLRSVGLRLPKGATDAGDLVLDAIDHDDGLWTVGPDGQVWDLAAILDGRTFTHRLTEREASEAALEMGDDLAGLVYDHLDVSGLTLPDGRVVAEELDLPSGDVLEFPLAPLEWADLGRAAGQLVGIAFAQGVATLAIVDEVGDDHELVLDLDRILARGVPVDVDSLFDELIVGTEHFRMPLAPMSEILPARGYVTSGDRVAASRAALAEDDRETEIEYLMQVFGLEREEAAVVAEIVGLVRVLEDAQSDAGAPQGRLDVDDPAVTEWVAGRMAELSEYLAGRSVPMLQLRRELADPWLAEATAAAALDPEDPCPSGLALLAELIEDTPNAPAGRAERAGLAYLIGRCHEFDGDPLAAEPCFQRAVALVPDHIPALLSQAGLAADRGSYEVALSLLDRVEAPPEHPLRTAIALTGATSGAPTRLPGRNEPCWCGSGRKFKVCHARVSTSPLPSRARSILARALAWAAVTDPGLLRTLLVQGVTVGGKASIDELVHVVPDALLFEGGALADYLERRGALIPADEALLAQQWLLRPRSLFDVEQVRPGVGLVMRDVVTGDRHEVAERTASRELKPGALVLTRVAPMGEEEQLFGGVVPIGLHERDQVIAMLAEEPSPPDVIAFVARRFAAPTVVTPEGDPMMAVTGSFTTSAPKRLRAALDARLGVAEDDSWNWTEEGQGLGGHTRVLASMTLTGRTLEVNTMSERRFEQVVTLLEGLDVDLVERSREVVDPVAAARTEPADGTVPQRLDPSDPEVAGVIADLVADWERSWLDESVPALGGMTPRAASQDPTRREDLIRLLDTFPASGSPTEMDGARLRAALGL